MPGEVYNPSVVVHFPGVGVFDAIPPAVMTDLDLSAVVGARHALVLLRVENQTGANCTVYTRTNGHALAIVGTGPSIAVIGVTNHLGYVCVVTDGAGIIEWFGTNVAGTVVLVVEAYAHA